jgi:hypothetical protein
MSGSFAARNAMACVFRGVINPIGFSVHTGLEQVSVCYDFHAGYHGSAR